MELTVFWQSASQGRPGLRSFIVFLVLLAGCCGLWSCVSTLLTADEVKAMNKDYATRVMTARQNIFASFSDPEAPNREILFRKGEKLRIWVEAEGDWLKVRAIRHGKPIENNPGRAIIYILREVLEDTGAPEAEINHYPREKLEAQIRQILQ